MQKAKQDLLNHLIETNQLESKLDEFVRNNNFYEADSMVKVGITDYNKEYIIDYMLDSMLNKY